MKRCQVWRLNGAVLAALSTGIAITVGPAAGAGTAPTAQTALQPAGGGSAVSVTLITGDRVLVRRGAGGPQVVTVVPAAARPSVGFLTARIRGDLYVLPRDIATMVPAVLDRSLFNVSALLRDGDDDGHTSTLPVVVAGDILPAAAMSGAGRPVPGRHATAVHVAKGSAADVGALLAAQQRAALASRRPVPAGLRRVWLDRPAAGPDRATEIPGPSPAGLNRDLERHNLT